MEIIPVSPRTFFVISIRQVSVDFSYMQIALLKYCIIIPKQLWRKTCGANVSFLLTFPMYPCWMYKVKIRIVLWMYKTRIHSLIISEGNKTPFVPTNYTKLAIKEVQKLPPTTSLICGKKIIKQQLCCLLGRSTRDDLQWSYVIINIVLS